MMCSGGGRRVAVLSTAFSMATATAMSTMLAPIASISTAPAFHRNTDMRQQLADRFGGHRGNLRAKHGEHLATTQRSICCQ